MPHRYDVSANKQKLGGLQGRKVLKKSEKKVEGNRNRLSNENEVETLNECLFNLSQLEPQSLFSQLLLTKPNTTKNSVTASNDKYEICVTSMQGWRFSMEDSSCLHLEIPNDSTNTALIGVFDGHGGSHVADYVSKHLHKYVKKQTEYKDNLKEAITKGFLEIDSKIRKNRPEEQSGSTAITVFIRNNTLYCANIGDSRAIAFENDKITPLSFDHKPTLPSEFKRITAAGGWVEAERVNGSLALSRALGDYQFKTDKDRKPENQIISCIPHIISHKIDKTWKFIVLACDGIWEVMSNVKVGEFINEKLNDKLSLEKISELLMNCCVAKSIDDTCLGCDNMTIAIILLKWPEKSGEK